MNIYFTDYSNLFAKTIAQQIKLLFADLEWSESLKFEKAESLYVIANFDFWEGDFSRIWIVLRSDISD